MKKVAMILSGCGVNDGSEITEAAGLIVALSQEGYDVDFYAPDRAQHDVIDHAAGRPQQDTRNILVESARIARGRIAPITSLTPAHADAVVLPGGFGAAKNLTSFAFRGQDATLAPDVAEALAPFLAAGKPLVALCAAPLVLALLARDAGISGARLTFGHEAEGSELIQAMEAWGQKHIETPVDEACIDSHHRLVTVPAYMYGAATPAEVFGACQSAVSALSWLLNAESEQ
jgi:enhancing lycopene biosynthesis protein 2